MSYLIFVFFIIAIAPSIGNAEDSVTPTNETAETISLPTNFTIANDEKVRVHKNRTTLKALLPSRKVCGRQHFDDYLHGSENDTDITVFPWMALLLYSINRTFVHPEWKCVGSLINTRYVLTLTTCLKSPIGTPVGVRLGDYNIDNDTDCITHRGIVQCSSFRDFTTEKVILHPQTMVEWMHYINDIGLIRLNQTVRYTDYIRPICLPLRSTKRPQIGDILVVSYWIVVENELRLNFSATKRQVNINLIHTEECNELMTIGRGGILCGLPIVTEGYLPYVLGSPLMSYKKRKLTWTLEGIAMDNPLFDLARTIPGVYTRVDLYLDWLEENMEP